MDTPSNVMTRRHALQTITGTALGAGLAGRLAAQDPNAAKPTPVPAPAFPKPTLHVYDSYGWLRGFGMVPSWAARIEDAWCLY